MAKGKGAAGSAVANRPAYSRVSFLYQAAALLARTSATQPAKKPTQKQGQKQDDSSSLPATSTPAQTPLQGMARRLLTQMRSVARKTNMRVRPAVKHRVCKYCDTLLVEGSTCLSAVENNSRGGRKQWADLLVVTCTTCGRARRYPVSASRQPRRPLRHGKVADDGRDYDNNDEKDKQKEGTAHQEVPAKKGKGAKGEKQAKQTHARNSKKTGGKTERDGAEPRADQDVRRKSPAAPS